MTMLVLWTAWLLAWRSVSAQQETTGTETSDGGHRLQPKDLVYRGAFRLPDDAPEEIGWGWSGQALAYCPTGDPDGPADGYPGSLFGTGHNWNQQVSELSIPAPVISESKTLDELPTARTLQPFATIRENLFEDMEQPRAGLAWLPTMGEQSSPKLYFCFAPHLDETGTAASHGWCEIDLAAPQPAGPWRIGDLRNYLTADYLFPIAPGFAATHLDGACLATGRFRDGGQGAMGPTILAIAPWKQGNPPAADAALSATVLLRYGSVYDPPEQRHAMRDYHHSDDWSGAAWLTAGEKSAVVFVGTKGRGKCWYGFANGVVWPEEGPWPEVPDYPNDQRGWWSSEFVAEMRFYDPAVLARVAAGELDPWQPQPYAVLEIAPQLYGDKTRMLQHVGAAAFDRDNGLLYILELRAEEDKPLIHVWAIAADET
jgi:hypothetical protein